MSNVAEDRATTTEAFVEHFGAGWAAGGPAERFVEHFAPRFTPETVLIQPLSPPLRGVEGLRRMAETLFEAMPDLRGEMVRWGPTDDGVIIELTLRGTLGRRQVEWTTADRIVLRDGQVVERRAYFDPTALLPAMLRSPRTALGLMRGMRTRKERS